MTHGCCAGLACRQILVRVLGFYLGLCQSSFVKVGDMMLRRCQLQDYCLPRSRIGCVNGQGGVACCDGLTCMHKEGGARLISYCADNK